MSPKSDACTTPDLFSRAQKTPDDQIVFDCDENLVLGIDLLLGQTFSSNSPGGVPDRFVNIENVVVSGKADFILKGSAVSNLLQTADGNDTLDGGTGVDTLIGGLGNDVYITDGRDEIIESASGGTDTIVSSASLTLIDYVEQLTLTGTGNISATGNALANVLNGGLGNDTLIGGAGRDTFVFNTVPMTATSIASPT